MQLKNIRKKLLSNISFLILFCGAGSNFLLTLLSKGFLEQDDFNTYSLFITYIGITSSFGLIGFDQVFLRLSKIESKRILLSYDVINVSFLLTFLVPILFSLYFVNKNNTLSFYQFLFAGVGINLLIISYNMLRLIREFSMSQILKNGFKVTTLIFTVCSVVIVNTNISINLLINFIVASIIVFAIFGVWQIKLRVKKLTTKSVSLISFFLSFSLNIAIITALSFGERLIILDSIGENEFGKYFYYSTIFLFPLTLVQQYVGFKELVSFKASVKSGIINKKIKEILKLGIFIIVITYIVSIVDNGFYIKVDFYKDIVLIISLSALGIIKLIYGLFSALLGAVGNTKEIYTVNLLTVALIILSLLYLFLVNLSLVAITINLLLIFLLRALYIYYSYVIKSR